ncbi:hypothetical protein WK18_29865 [Burkholderia ubonensis]|nr:hypothetical protein WK18_29865 [Burkholderia ubonensis]KVV01730.1 hypothetical protein WK77_18935 [Burkholderia ubonensis]KVZ45646.1 hypothetical protein WL16_22940 [Burkholderia ubonensis]KWB77010.1 hypothetical protein WL41_00775 [Burkholderia ubonensis]KWC53065.1 hypothetical protein WL52_03985 [Burkholderia ubonensis]
MCVAMGIAVAWSVTFLRRVLMRKKITWGDVKTWTKNVIESLFGMGERDMRTTGLHTSPRSSDTAVLVICRKFWGLRWAWRH